MTLTMRDENIQGYVSRVDIGVIRIGRNFALEPGQGYLVRMIHANAAWEIGSHVVDP
jgi:hypothetical protein